MKRKTYSESRVELQNAQILNTMLEESNQCLSSEQPCQPKRLDISLKIAGVEKIHSSIIIISKKKMVFLLPASHTCSIPQQDFFGSFSHPVL